LGNKAGREDRDGDTVRETLSAELPEAEPSDGDANAAPVFRRRGLRAGDPSAVTTQEMAEVVE